MKRMAAGEFKAKCLAVMDEVQATGEPVVITKRGNPVARLIAEPMPKDDIFGFWRGKGKIVGDIVSPISPWHEWNVMREAPPPRPPRKRRR